jgi:hypothetical protein
MMRLTKSYHTRALVPTQECKSNWVFGVWEDGSSYCRRCDWGHTFLIGSAEVGSASPE